LAITASVRSWNFAFALLSGAAIAHTPEQPPHQTYTEGDLKLESGEVIKDFSISYVTHGNLNEKKNNAILMTSSIAGNHHRIEHFAASPAKAADVEFMNKKITEFLDSVTDNGKLLQAAPGSLTDEQKARFNNLKSPEAISSRPG
jgi:hypothetical protein